MRTPSHATEIAPDRRFGNGIPTENYAVQRDVQESRAMPLNLPSPSLFAAMLTANVAVR